MWTAVQRHPHSKQEYTTRIQRTTTAVASPNATNIQATGVTTIGDFAIGETCNATTTISYADTPYCSSEGTAAVVLTGNTRGTYTSSAGLAINASSGAVNLTASSTGDYVVTYTVGASGGCSVFITTSDITVTTAPAATASYPSSSYCSSAGIAAVTLIGTPGGQFTSTAGLLLNPGNGLVDLANSTAGSYTVTYTIPASGGCPQFSTTTGISITTQPFASGTYEAQSLLLEWRHCISNRAGCRLAWNININGGTFNRSVDRCSQPRCKHRRDIHRYL